MEDQKERAMRVERRSVGLVYIIVVIFIALLITTYFLHQNMQEVKILESHKKVLINRLGEEVLFNRRLQKETDSLKRYMQTHEPVSLSSDFQTAP